MVYCDKKPRLFLLEGGVGVCDRASEHVIGTLEYPPQTNTQRDRKFCTQFRGVLNPLNPICEANSAEASNRSGAPSPTSPPYISHLISPLPQL